MSNNALDRKPRSSCSLSLVFGSWIGAVVVLPLLLRGWSAERVAVTAAGWQPRSYAAESAPYLGSRGD